VGRAQAFLDLIRYGVPQIYQEFMPLMEQNENAWNPGTMKSIYQRLSTADFSRLVLSTAPDRLGVWCLGDVGWSDLGDPHRVVTMMSETGMNNEWMTSWRERSLAVAAGH
jgi:hypothetical protein